jgi:hypothetical protein
MKVRFRGHTVEKPDWRWLTVGRCYDVLAIEPTGRERKPAYRIESDDNATPALFEVDLFDVVDGSIPPSWCVIESQGAIAIGPRAWFEPGFWESYFDGKEDATKAYARELELIRRSLPAEPVASSD